MLPAILICRILRALALDDVDGDLDLVARHFLDFRIDAHGVFAAREILVGEVLLHLIQRRLVERLARREADVAQRLLQVFGLDVLVALDLEALDRGTLEHGDDERAAVATQFDVTEESGRVHRAQCFRDATRIELIADVDRQIIEDRAFGDALQAFDADVADREALRRADCAERQTRAVAPIPPAASASVA